MTIRSCTFMSEGKFIYYYINQLDPIVKCYNLVKLDCFPHWPRDHRQFRHRQPLQRPLRGRRPKHEPHARPPRNHGPHDGAGAAVADFNDRGGTAGLALSYFQELEEAGYISYDVGLNIFVRALIHEVGDTTWNDSVIAGAISLKQINSVLSRSLT